MTIYEEDIAHLGHRWVDNHMEYTTAHSICVKCRVLSDEVGSLKMCTAAKKKEEKTMDQTDIEHRFTHHPPKGDQGAKYIKLRNLAKQMANHIDGLCPDSREKSLAITKLEEVVFWANAAIARNE